MRDLAVILLLQAVATFAAVMIARATGAEKKRSLLLLVLAAPMVLGLAFDLTFMARPDSVFPRPDWLLWLAFAIPLSILPAMIVVIAYGRKFRLVAALFGLLQTPFTLVIGFLSALLVGGVMP